MGDVARINSGKLTFERVKVDLSELVSEELQNVLKAFGKPPEWAERRLEKDVIGVWGKTEITKAVRNLLNNAIKFGEGKPFFVSVSREGTYAKLAIQDHGIGISPENQSKIFEYFERGISITHYGGFGLGLYTAQSFVSAHGGSIQVKSQIGFGSLFTVLIPLNPTRTASGK